MTAISAMVHKEPRLGYSLHHLSSSHDSGPVLDIRTAPIDDGKSMLHDVNDVYPIGVEVVEMVVDAVETSQGTEICQPWSKREPRVNTTPCQERRSLIWCAREDKAC